MSESHRYLTAPLDASRSLEVRARPGNGLCTMTYHKRELNENELLFDHGGKFMNWTEPSYIRFHSTKKPKGDKYLYFDKNTKAFGFLSSIKKAEGKTDYLMLFKRQIIESEPANQTALNNSTEASNEEPQETIALETASQ